MEIDLVDLVAVEAADSAVAEAADSVADEVSVHAKCIRLPAQTVAKNVKFLSSPAVVRMEILDPYIAGIVTRTIKSSKSI